MENPLQYYVRKAADFGIAEKVLRSTIKPTSNSLDRETVGRLTPLIKKYGLDGMRSFELPAVSYESEVNNGGLKLTAGDSIGINPNAIDAALQDPWKLGDLAVREHYFNLVGIYGRFENFFVGMGVTNSDITWAEIIEVKEMKGIPKEFFMVGKAYRLALEWMLLAYAGRVNLLKQQE